MNDTIDIISANVFTLWKHRLFGKNSLRQNRPALHY